LAREILGPNVHFSEEETGMKKSIRGLLLVVVASSLMSGCIHQSSVSFPDPADIFITSGDGDIQKPYTPVGEFLYVERGFRIPLPLLAFLNVADTDPDLALRENVVREVRAMGGDALINMRMLWTPPRANVLALFGIASGGSIAITGTVIRR
jgi:hypothetical protein